MRLADLVATSDRVAESSGRLAKVGHLTSLLKTLPEREIEIAVSFLSGSARQGRIGIGASVLTEVRSVPAAGEPARSSWSKLHSMAFRRARSIPAASRCGSRA